MPAGAGAGAGAATQDVGFAPAQSFETRLQQLQADRAARLRLAKEDLVTLESFSAGKVDVGIPLRYRARYQRLLRGMHVCLLCPQ